MQDATPTKPLTFLRRDYQPKHPRLWRALLPLRIAARAFEIPFIVLGILFQLALHGWGLGRQIIYLRQ